MSRLAEIFKRHHGTRTLVEANPTRTLNIGARFLNDIFKLCDALEDEIQTERNAMGLTAQVISGLESQLATANASLATAQAELTAAKAVALDQADAQKIVEGAGTQTPPITVTPEIIALAGTPAAA